jgi:hypothetical protein
MSMRQEKQGLGEEGVTVPMGEEGVITERARRSGS